MANKYTRKGKEKDKEPILSPDEFVSFWTKAYDALLPHVRTITIGAGAAVAVLLVSWAVSTWRSGAREDATEQFGKAVKMYEAELITDTAPAKPDDDVQRFKTEKERGEAVVGEIEKLEKDHAHANAAKEAGLYKAGVLYDLGRYPDAATAWKKFADEADAADPMRVVALEGVGLCLENQGKLDEALAVYKDLAPKTGEFFKDRALYDQARVVAAKGDRAGAEKIYKDILGRTTTGPLRDDVQSRLAALGGA